MSDCQRDFLEIKGGGVHADLGRLSKYMAVVPLGWTPQEMVGVPFGFPLQPRDSKGALKREPHMGMGPT